MQRAFVLAPGDWRALLLYVALVVGVGPHTLQPPALASSLRRSPIVEAVLRAGPSVVSIHGRKTVPADDDAGGQSQSAHQVNGMGTGIVIDSRGYVLTNYHVVEGVTKIQVTLADESTTIATLIANDAKTDLALIKVESELALPVIKLGTSCDLMPGETVVAVGNAYGYEHTVTRGIISALHRSVQVSDFQKYHDLIQTDASINPGNSGGPLLNIDGDMIGINVAVRVGAQGIGFAIPVDQAMEVAARLLSAKQIDHMYHGLRVRTDNEPSGSRAIVDEVVSGSPADKAGVRVGDVLETINGQEIHRALDVARVLLDGRVGEEMPLQLSRNGQRESLSLVLDRGQQGPSAVVDQAWQLLGLRLAPISSSVFRRYQSRYRGGLKIVNVRPDSPAAHQGLRRGDILVGLYKWETASEDNVAYILKSAEFQTQQPVKFYILRNGETLFGHMQLAGR